MYSTHIKTLPWFSLVKILWWIALFGTIWVIVYVIFWSNTGCFEFDARTQTITWYKEKEMFVTPCSKDVVIPQTIGHTTVSAIWGYVFMGNELTSITIPESVTSIWDRAFWANWLNGYSWITWKMIDDRWTWILWGPEWRDWIRQNENEYE